MDNGYMYLPVYSLYLAGIIFLLMILILMCLLYIILCKRFKINDSNRLRVSVPEAQEPKPKTSSFHLPKIQFANKFERLRSSNDGLVSRRSSNTPRAHYENQSEQNNSCPESDKINIPNPIAIIPREKMAALCEAILNNKDRKVNLEKLEKFDIRDDHVIYQINERKSFANLKDRSTSVPDLGIYDVVGTIRPVELKKSTAFEDSNELYQSTAEICRTGFDRNSGKMLSYLNASGLVYDNSSDSGYTPYSDRIETYLVPVIFAIIFIVGVLGNGTLVIVYIRHRGMRNAPNTYIFSLALADLLVILICVPFVSVIYTLESWPWGEAICRISETGKDISIGVSVFTLTALSAERYCAIVNPFRKLQLRKLPLVCATIIWAAALIFAAPAALFSSTIYHEIDNNVSIIYCSPYPETWDNYAKWMTLTKALVYYALPLLVIAFFYSLMAQRLLASTKEMPGALHGGQGEAQAKARKSVACMVLIFVIVFFICFLPYHALEVWYYLSPTAQTDYNDFTHALRIIAFCLSFLNSCVNPVALYCVSGVFRQHFNRYLCCRRGALHPTCSSRLSRTAICETSFRSTQRHRCNRYAFIHLQIFISTRFLNSCVNPIALCSMSDVYKKYFIRYVCCKKDVLQPRQSSRSMRMTRETAFGGSQRHTFKRNPTESIVISNYDYGSTKKKNNIISRNSTDGVTIMTVRDSSDFMNDVNEKCIER